MWKREEKSRLKEKRSNDPSGFYECQYIYSTHPLPSLKIHYWPNSSYFFKMVFFFILSFSIDTYPCPVETTGADLAVHEGAGRSLDRRGKSADAHPWGK